jgi:hypothetical protein
MKKYIVSEQQPNGDFYVTQPLRVKSGDYTVAAYRALLTQTNTLSATDIDGFYGAFIPGETYTIEAYQEGDNFSNIANVVSGNINESGCIFEATGERPWNWTEGSQLASSGSLVVHVIESELDYSLEWSQLEPGIYNAKNSDTNYLYRSFPKRNVVINTNKGAGPGGEPSPNIEVFGAVMSVDELDDSIGLFVYDRAEEAYVEGAYYTPIEILIKQYVSDIIDTYSVSIGPKFPFTSPGLAIGSGPNTSEWYQVAQYNCDDDSEVENASELIDRFNNDDVISQLGTFSINNNGDIYLEAIRSIKEQFSPNGVLSFGAVGEEDRPPPKE